MSKHAANGLIAVASFAGLLLVAALDRGSPGFLAAVLLVGSAAGAGLALRFVHA